MRSAFSTFFMCLTTAFRSVERFFVAAEKGAIMLDQLCDVGVAETAIIKDEAEIRHASRVSNLRLQLEAPEPAH